MDIKKEVSQIVTEAQMSANVDDVFQTNKYVDAILALFTHLIEEEVIGSDEESWVQIESRGKYDAEQDGEYQNKIRNKLRAEQRSRLIEAVKGNHGKT